MDHARKANFIEREVLKYHNCVEEWKPMKPHKGVSISYMKSPHFSGNIYRFECEVDAPDDVVYKVMKPPTNTEDRLSWDKSIKDYLCLKEISEDIILSVIITHSVMAGLISMREFVDMYYFKSSQPSNHKDYDRISWIFAENIELPERPISKKYVRACNYPTGYGIARSRSNPQKSILILYINCDIGGMIPQSLVETALPSEQVCYVESVRAQVKRVLAGQA